MSKCLNDGVHSSLFQICQALKKTKTVSHEIIFEVFQPMQKTYLNLTDELLPHNCTLHSITQ